MPLAATRHNAKLFLAEVVRQAVLAPSAHNSQPWRFRLEDDRLDLLADRSRALPVNDPHDRELTISCGAALLNTRVAASSGGAGLDVRLLPDADDPDLLARAVLDGEDSRDAALFGAIADRRTYRDEFQGLIVDDEILAELVDAAEAEGAHLDVLDERRRATFLELVAEGSRRQFGDSRWRAELASWLHARRDGDGLMLPELVAPATRFVVRHFDMGAGTARRDVELAQRSRAIVVLSTDGDTAEEWLRAGQALQRVLLTAAAHGVQASFLNQPMQVVTLRPQASALVAGGGVAQLALRLGYPSGAAHAAPRRPAEHVIEYL